jgi:two-component system KDP operon response regulator KdpE
MPLEGVERVLVIDGEAETAALVKDALAGAGCEVLHAADGGQAQTFLMTKTPDFVLLESELKNESGVEVAARIKSVYPDLPVVLMGASVSPLDAQHAGADACLRKRFNANQLVQTIHLVASRREERRERLESDRIHFECPQCKKRMRARATYKGRRMRCPRCGASFTVHETVV